MEKETREKILIQWWRGWYMLGWRGHIAHWLLKKELEKFPTPLTNK